MLKVDMLTLKGGGESMAGKGLGPLLTVEDVGVCNSATLSRPAGLNVEGVERWQGQDNLGFSSQAFELPEVEGLDVCSSEHLSGRL